MALESTTYIDGLVSTNPAGTDPRSQGDDHLRLIKSAIKTTFPSISGEVTATHVELNHLDGVTSTVATLASPALTGNPTAPTPASGDDDTSIATTAFVQDALTAHLLTVYPVGSIYCTVETTNPATAFGGTWVAFGSGRVMVGQQSSAHDSTGTGADDDFKSRGGIGGAKTHTLTVAEMPAHNHENDSNDRLLKIDGSNTSESTDSSAGEPNLIHTKTIKSAGGGGAHNNLQPYIVVRFWERTA